MKKSPKQLSLQIQIANICWKHTADKQDLIYTLGFELLSLCNEAWHMLVAMNIEEMHRTESLSTSDFSQTNTRNSELQ